MRSHGPEELDLRGDRLAEQHGLSRSRQAEVGGAVPTDTDCPSAWTVRSGVTCSAKAIAATDTSTSTRT